jgi:hypothetical protein
MNMRKGEERKTIEGMVTKPKPITEKKEKSFNSVINRIISFLRKNDKFATLHEINKDLKDYDLKSNKELLNFLSTSSQKLRYDERTETFSLNSKYKIKNIDELKDLIRTSETGIAEDEELTDSYPGVKADLERLKRENYVKVIVNDEKKTNVLFYRDTADRVEKLLIDSEYKEAITELRKIWKDELTYYAKDDEGTFIRKRKRINEEISKKGEKRQRRNKKLANTHLAFFKNMGY